MYRVLSRRTVLCLALTAVVACGPSGPTEEEVASGREAEVAEVEQAKQALDALRAERQQLRDQLAAPAPEASGEEGTAAEPLTDEARQELQTQIDALDLRIEDGAETLGGLIIEKINANPPTQGEPLDTYQQRLVDMKVDEDLLTAQEWIDKGGDYARAIAIYDSLLPLDPQNARVNEARAAADSARYMTEERFAQIKKGMSEDEVRAILGPVNLRNIRPYPDKGVVLWLYPREDGNAAGIYFREQKGKQAVYSLDYNAVTKKDGSEGEEG